MSAEIVQIRTDRETWLDWRRQGIGGSDAAVVCGVDRWRSPMALWLEKTGQLVDDQASEAALWGQLLEPAIADEFERREGVWVHHRQALRTHPERDWMRATVDGVVYDNQAGDGDAIGLYEGKTTSARHEESWRDGVPDHYQLQVQHNLAVTGLERAWVTCLIGGQQLIVHVVERDQELIDLLMDLEATFWQRVLDREAPPVDGSEATAEALKAAFAHPVLESVELPETALELIQRHEVAKLEEKLAKERSQQVQNELMALLGEAEVGLIGGKEVVTWKRIEQQRFDTEAFRSAHADLAAEFMKPGGYRRLTVKKQKAAAGAAGGGDES